MAVGPKLSDHGMIMEIFLQDKKFSKKEIQDEVYFRTYLTTPLEIFS